MDVGVNSSDCGYCGGEDCSVSHGMPVRGLTVYQYQGAWEHRVTCSSRAFPLPLLKPGPCLKPDVDAPLHIADLIDQGWRRSGTYLYKVRGQKPGGSWEVGSSRPQAGWVACTKANGVASMRRPVI